MKKKKLSPGVHKPVDNISELKKKFLVYYRQLPVQKLAAESIGRSEETVILWKKQDQDFYNQCFEARAKYAQERSKKASPEWVLERIINDHFKAPRHEHDLNISVAPLTIIKATVLDNETTPTLPE